VPKEENGEICNLFFCGACNCNNFPFNSKLRHKQRRGGEEEEEEEGEEGVGEKEEEEEGVIFCGKGGKESDVSRGSLPTQLSHAQSGI